MARAWPFDRRPEPQDPYRDPSDFVARHGDGTEAVIVRIGVNGAQLVLVAADGRWERWVYPSEEAARDAVAGLDVPVHVGAYPEGTRVRVNAYRRALEDYEAGAYPEQGRVGLVISYPENRPRPAPPEDEEEFPHRG